MRKTTKSTRSKYTVHHQNLQHVNNLKHNDLAKKQSMFKIMVLKTFVALFTILNNVTGFLPNVNKVVSLFVLWIISLRSSNIKHDFAPLSK
jgi:hypothetical protein